MYTLYRFKYGNYDNYLVTWYDPETGIIYAQQDENWDPYMVNRWYDEEWPEGFEETKEIMGRYDNLNDAWWDAMIDELMYKGPTDDRLHPHYSYLKKAV